MTRVELVESCVDRGSESEFETAIEQHNTSWENYEKVFRIEDMLITMKCYNSKTNIIHFDEYEATKFNTPLSIFSDPLSKSETTIVMKWNDEEIVVDAAIQKNNEFLARLWNISSVEDIDIPVGIRNQIIESKNNQKSVLSLEAHYDVINSLKTEPESTETSRRLTTALDNLLEHEVDFDTFGEMIKDIRALPPCKLFRGKHANQFTEFCMKKENEVVAEFDFDF
jgi:hypothetical protein